MGLKRAPILLSVMVLVLVHMATGRPVRTTTLPIADFETMNMSGETAFGTQLLSSARPRGGNYIDNPQAANKAAIQTSGYHP
ncbi:hypothetical protein SDJN03_05413, partial [Cucurbita argyrosperma subsp. sororia]